MKKNLRHVGENELTHSMVHYLLTIHRLKEDQGYARVTDIAKALDLTKGSVSTALGNLKKKGLVDEDESKFLSLSSQGHDQVHNILSARTLLYYFLADVLEVKPATAQHDSCLMEHLLSDETREKFFKFLKKLSHSKEFKMSLDLSQFKNTKQFINQQKGDSFLKDPA